MKTIALPKTVVDNAAAARGVTACEEIDRLLSSFFGRKMCSHLCRKQNLRGKYIFAYKCVPISNGRTTRNGRSISR